MKEMRSSAEMDFDIDVAVEALGGIFVIFVFFNRRTESMWPQPETVGVERTAEKDGT